MTWSLRTRVRRMLAVAALAPLTLVAGLSATGTASAASGGPDNLKVMTRNLYLGADLMPAVLALASTTDPNAIAAAAGQVWTAVQASDPPGRMAAVADEIAAWQPDLVGLQEVTTWQLCTLSGCTTAYDFQQLLLDALAARGLHYAAVPGATSTNFASPMIPLPPLGAAPLVTLTDHDVILYRTDAPRGGLALSNAATGHFTARLAFPLASGGSLPVLRGWGSVDVTKQGDHFRFVNTHLEAFGIPGVNAEGLRMLQVGELLAGPLAGSGEKVLVGDLNSEAALPHDADAYDLLRSAGFGDAWLTAHPTLAGYSCCQAPDLQNTTSQLDQRIDLVLVENGVATRNAHLVGDDPVPSLAPVMWPSDHAGLASMLVVG